MTHRPRSETARSALEGNLGFFALEGASGWEEPVLRGYVQQIEGLLEVELLEEVARSGLRGLFEAEESVPKSVAGWLTSGGMLLPTVASVSKRVQIGGSRASTRTLTARTALLNVPDPRQADPVSIGLRYPGLIGWSGMEVEGTQVEVDSSGRPRKFVITLESPDSPAVGRISGGSISVEAHWGTTRAAGATSVQTALQFTVRSRTLSLQEMADPLMAIHELVCLAFNGWVVPTSGHARLANGQSCKYWNGNVMWMPTDWPTGDLTKPFFSLSDIGGPRGLARWIRLVADHPRAVSPVLLPFEGGRASEEVLVGSCVGVEYWVSANKHRWAGPGLKGYNKLLALVARIGGQAWSEIVGDVPRWADAVWGDYSSLKHNPAAPVDPKRVQVLGLSVRLALELALLRELAGNQQVTRRFQEAEALQGLRHGVEHVLN